MNAQANQPETKRAIGRRSLFALAVTVLVALAAFFPEAARAAEAPGAIRVEASETNGVPSQITLFDASEGSGRKTYHLYLPGTANTAACRFSWDGGTQLLVDGVRYESGACPVPAANEKKTYSLVDGNETLYTFDVATYQGSPNVQTVFIVVDESEGNPTIEQMDSDPNHQVGCKGDICISGTWYKLSKIKGRGNNSWAQSDDKKPYNVTLDTKINFPGIDSDKTKKWSFLAEVLDHSLLANRTGYYLASQLGIGQDTTSADVWMNGEYRGCYTVTPKTDSFVSKDGYLLENDNYLEPAVSEGGDPQFALKGLNESTSDVSYRYNRITVKKIGDNLLTNAEGEVDESTENVLAVTEEIKAWMQEAWDAMRSETGYNSKGKYYTEYIDIQSFAKMYLVQEYVKNYDICSGSLYLYRTGTTDADKLKCGPVWDLDNAMGATIRNKYIGAADDRVNGDRRSGEGNFIPQLNDWKTCILKTLLIHPDFVLEVFRQYNTNRDIFEAMPYVVDYLAAEIEASALMNHQKVNELPYDSHLYSSAVTLSSGKYAQKYLATTDAKTDWPNRVANLRTYLSARSLWFKNTFSVAQTGWVSYDGYFYYIKDWVALKNGWVNQNGRNVYVQNYRLMKEGWASDGANWYYIKDYFVLANGFVSYAGQYYCIKNYTLMKEGWVAYGSTYCYVKDYILMKDGWVKYNGKWCYIKDYTLMNEGWVKYNGKYYYIRGRYAVTNDWVKYNGKYYYINGSGNPVTNTWLRINGTWYHFNSQGVVDRTA